MKTKALLLAFTLFAAAFGFAPRAAAADGEVSFQFFYDTLSPYGDWVQVGDYGDCWRPTGVDEDWSPYTDGYWSYTDAGWTWVSYEDWGGVTYHYGRWVNAEDVGWCWVPDYEWGPAWVSWRHNDNDVGWAPLPPTARWRASVGISTWCDDAYDIGPSYYNFCPVVDFGAPLIRSVCYPRSRNVVFISQTINVTNITYNTYNNVIFCGGPSFVFINAHSHHQVPALKLVTNININKTGRAWTNAHTVGNTLQVYAPKIVNNNTTIINRPKITKIVNKEKINNGWNGMKDPAEKAKLRNAVKQQNKGLNADTAPAKPVKAEDLKVLPAKADPKAPSPVAITNKVRKDRDGDGIPDAPKGEKIANENAPKNPAKDRNGDGVPDAAQPGKVANGNAPKNPARDKNGDGIPDNKVGVGEPNRGVKIPGKDRDGDGIPDGPKPGKVVIDDAPKNPVKDKNGDGVPDRPVRDQGGFKPPVAGQGQGGLKREREQADPADAARRQAEMADKQRRLQEQQSKIDRQQQAEREQRKLERSQQDAEQGQRARQMEREAQAAQAAKQQRQAEAQRRISEGQRQQQMQRQQQQQVQPRQQQPQQQQFNPGGGGGQGKGKKQLTPEEAEALKKQRGF